MPSEDVHQGIELLVSIVEPRLGARGSLIAASVRCEVPDQLRGDEARRLADALRRAADLADAADRKLVPILESYTAARDRLLRGEE